MDLRHLPDGAAGVLPSQMIEAAVDAGYIETGDFKLPDDAVQPASLDLHLGETAYRLRCSFLPDRESVAAKMKPLVVDELDLRREGAVLEPNRPYLIPLIERLRLPPNLRARANPKSSTGRLDVFTRVVSDYSFRFDEIGAGYSGALYLEVVPLSFAVRVRAKLSLNQLRLIIGRPLLSDDELRAQHERTPLLYRHDVPVPGENLATANGLFVALDLQGDVDGLVGYRARQNTPGLDMAALGSHRVDDYWERIVSSDHDRGRVVLDEERFYLLLSDEAVSVPPELAAEMTAFDPTSGELRTHYAGFFDPGFGYSDEGDLRGSRAALEVRAHDVPFMIEHRQRVCKLTYERMLERPDRLYGSGANSHYQGQVDTLSKHFQRKLPADVADDAADDDRDQLGLFDGRP